jgi:hypothetical protein
MYNQKHVTMSPDEKKEFSVMQGDIKQIKGNLTQLATNMDKVYFALMGNEITGKDQSLIGRVEKIEEDIQQLKTRMEEITSEAGKSKIYLNLVWIAAGAIGMGILTRILALIFKTP